MGLKHIQYSNAYSFSTFKVLFLRKVNGMIGGSSILLIVGYSMLVFFFLKGSKYNKMVFNFNKKK